MNDELDYDYGKVDVLVQVYTDGIEDAIRQERSTQLRRAHEEDRILDMIGTDGKIRYDRGAINLVYSMTIDSIDRELGALHLREDISRDEYDDIIERIELSFLSMGCA